MVDGYTPVETSVHVITKAPEFVRTAVNGCFYFKY